MSCDTNNAVDGNSLLRSSSLYREFQAEREEILRHKWLESEKAGYDIGFEWALTDWIMKHRSKWKKNRQMETHTAVVG
jgi:hypothetical protein